MTRTNWSALSGVDNYSGKAARVDRQKQLMAKDRQTAGRAAGRDRKSI